MRSKEMIDEARLWKLCCHKALHINTACFEALPCVRARACVRARVRACVRALVRALVR